jgi:hypothetical protein
MARIPTHVAARIDRLSRTAHRFHRFAHHPLCSEYGGELVRLGRRNRVCRGCLFTGIGGLTGLGVSFVARAPLAFLAILLVGGLAVLVTTVQRRSAERQSTEGERLPKVVSRLMPALVIAYALGGAVQSGVAGGALAALSIAPLVGVMVVYRRRGPDRTPCATCVERNRATPCRGVAPIVRRERAFRRLAGQWLARAGS